MKRLSRSRHVKTSSNSGTVLSIGENDHNAIEMEVFLSAENAHGDRFLPCDCAKIVAYWIRTYALEDPSSTCLYIPIIASFAERQVIHHKHCIEWQVLPTTQGTSIVKLLNTKQSFMIHQDKFRQGRSKNHINFKALSKFHSVSLNQCVPSIAECSLCCYEFELYQKYVDHKKYDLHHSGDRRRFPMDGTHKLGIQATDGNKTYFIGIMSFFDFNACRNKYSRHKQNGLLYQCGGNARNTLIRGETALRKHEIIEMKINWIESVLIFNRITSFSDHVRPIVGMTKDHHEIRVAIDLNVHAQENNIHLLQWYPLCSVCVNDVDSFMWNSNQDKDFISYTIKNAYWL